MTPHSGSKERSVKGRGHGMSVWRAWKELLPNKLESSKKQGQAEKYGGRGFKVKGEKGLEKKAASNDTEGHK